MTDTFADIMLNIQCWLCCSCIEGC